MFYDLKSRCVTRSLSLKVPYMTKAINHQLLNSSIVWEELSRIVQASSPYPMKVKLQYWSSLNSHKTEQNQTYCLDKRPGDSFKIFHILFLYFAGCCKSVLYVCPTETSLLNFVDFRNHMCHQKCLEEISFLSLRVLVACIFITVSD